MHDGVDIPEATSNVFTISSAELDDAGVYICKITNTIATALTLSSRSVHVAVYNPNEISGLSAQAPRDYTLYQNYPNPFNPLTHIRYALAEISDINIIVFNTLGQQVFEYSKKSQPAGYYTIQFDGNSLNSGIYFYKLSAKNYNQVKKMVLIK
jgi:hypothetical protein